MQPARCSHCGKPLYTGFLCSDCQALRSYQPQLFAGDSYAAGNRFQIDKGAVFAVCSLLAISAGIWIFYPSMQRMAKRPETKMESATAIVNKFKSKVDLGKYTSEMSDQESSSTPDLISSIPTTQSTAGFPRTQESLPGTRARIAPLASTAEGLSSAGNFEPKAHETFNAFLVDYCQKRSSSTGKKVVPTSIMWLPGGSGAIVAFDLGGKFRQGTAQYSPQHGWTWIVAPDATDATQ